MYIFPTNTGSLVAGRGEANDPRAPARDQKRQQRISQNEMAEMVGGKLAFPVAPHPRLGTGHDAGIVNQQIEPVFAVSNSLGIGLYTIQIREVHLTDNDVPGYAGQSLRRFFRRAQRNVYLGTGVRQRSGCFQTNSAIAAGNNRYFAIQVNTRQHLVRLAPGAESGVDSLLFSGHYFSPWI